MGSREYKANVKKADAAIEKTIADGEKSVQRILKKALDSMRVELSRIYAKYAKDGKLTLADMTQYNRLASLYDNMAKSLTPAIRATLAEFDRLPPEVYGDAYFRSAWAMDSGYGISLNWGTLDKRAILAALQNPYTAMARNGYSKSALGYVRKAIEIGLSQGKGYPEMAKGLLDAMNILAYQATRIVRTEGQRAANEARKDAYAEAEAQGVKGVYVWEATLDDRTRDSHADMDGQERTADELFDVNGNPAQFPLDPSLPAEESINCRCRVAYNVNGESPILRRTKEEGVIMYRNYEEWEKKKAFMS